MPLHADKATRVPARGSRLEKTTALRLSVPMDQAQLSPGSGVAVRLVDRLAREDLRRGLARPVAAVALEHELLAGAHARGAAVGRES
jgi:hypothetical protein